MEFTRHARNRLRLYNLTTADADTVAANGAQAGTDTKGNPIVHGQTDDDRTIALVIAGDKPTLIITLYPVKE